MSGAGGHELLREVDGVVGSLLSLVEIDEGWDAAFEAAAGAGVATVVVDGPRSAQRALTTLRDRGVTGAVLAPRTVHPVSVTDLPAGSSAEPLRRHVRARQGGAAAESVLDALVGRAVARRRLGGGDRPVAGPRRPDRGDSRRATASPPRVGGCDPAQPW